MDSSPGETTFPPYQTSTSASPQVGLTSPPDRKSLTARFTFSVSPEVDLTLKNVFVLSPHPVKLPRDPEV